MMKNKNLLEKLKCKLSKTNYKLTQSILKLFNVNKIDNNLINNIEEQLIIADVGITTTKKIITHLKKQIMHSNIRDISLLKIKLYEVLLSILIQVEQPLILNNHYPFIILMIGVNGTGKTTTIGKLTYQYKLQGKSIILVAGDTFRAAAAEQLQIWGKLNNVSVITKKHAKNPASIIFDAIKLAKLKRTDILIIDTAGRLHNKINLMEEISKIIKVIKKFDINAPHEVALIIDANIGQNSINQVYFFNKIVNITGIIVTKLDGTAKGGTIFSIADNFRIPIRYIGIGENIEDLQIFNAKNFIKAIFPN